MKWKEANVIYDEWALKYVGGSSYHGHIHSAHLTSRRDAVKYGRGQVELPLGESLEGLCIMVNGSVDNLPADVPKPENSYKGLLVLYKNDGPVELQHQEF